MKSQNYMWNCWDFRETNHLKRWLIDFPEELGEGFKVKFTLSSPFHVSERLCGAVLPYESSWLFSDVMSILRDLRITELTCFLNLAFSKKISFSTFLNSSSILDTSLLLLSFLLMPETTYSLSWAKSGAWSIFWTKNNNNNNNEVMARKEIRKIKMQQGIHSLIKKQR